LNILARIEVGGECNVHDTLVTLNDDLNLSREEIGNKGIFMKISEALDLGILKVEQFFPLKEGISIDTCGYFLQKDNGICFCALGMIFCGSYFEEFSENKISFDDDIFRRASIRITGYLFEKFPQLNDELNYQRITKVLYQNKYKHISNIEAYELFWEARDRNC
jgi:hypothetical protein